MIVKEKNEKMKKELVKMSDTICHKLIKSYKKGELGVCLEEKVIDIQKDDDGDISHIIFTLGGPYVHLDLYGNRHGCVVAEDIGHTVHSVIPWDIWLDMRNELEEYYEAY